MNRATAGWVVAALCFGLWWGQGANPARAQEPGRVECKAFYQDFPNGVVGPAKAVEKADQLGAQLDPWLEQQFGAGADAVVLHSFIPYGTAGGAELICAAWR